MSMAASAIFARWIYEQTAPASLQSIAILFAAGGFAAFVPALVVARLIPSHRPESAFAIAFIAFVAATIFFTGLVFGLFYRLDLVEDHSDPFTWQWLVGWAFRIAASIYQFAVLGLRLYFPIGLIALFAVSFWHAKRSR